MTTTLTQAIPSVASGPAHRSPAVSAAGSVRPRVLLIAEACNPEWVSVPLVGFNLYDALRRVADVTLVTQVRNRAALSRRLEAGQRIAFIDSELLAAPFSRLAHLLTLGRGLGWTTGQAVNWLPYLYFEHLVWRQFGPALRRGEFDLIHRITPLTPTYPSPLAGRTDVPFILGPINGGLPWPPGTTRTRLAEMEWLSYLREAYRLLPYVRQTYQRAATVIAGSRHTFASLPRSAQERALYMPENGIHPDRFNADRRLPPSQVRPFRVLFAGRLVPYKGADVVLEAFAASSLRSAGAEVVIAGDGPQRRSLEGLVASLGITGQVRFTGNLPQAELVDQFRGASVFAFPSLREFGGGVIVEAMACGLPCIVLDHGGPAEHVTAHTGMTLPVLPRRELVQSLRHALDTLAADPARLDAMSVACVERIRSSYTWSAKAERILELYRTVTGNRRPQDMR